LEALRLDRELGERERAQLLLALGYAQMRLGANETAGRTFLEAVELARKTTDHVLFARAAQGFENTGWRQGHHGQKAVALLEEALARTASSDRRAIAELNSALCRADIYARRPREAIIAHRLAVKTARELGEPYILFHALGAIVPAKLWPELLEARLEAATEAMALAESCGHPEWAVLYLTGWSVYDFLEAGEVQTARKVLDLHVRIADVLRDPFLQTVGQSAKTILAMSRDVGPSVEADIRQTLALGQRWSVDNAAGAYGLQMFTLQRERGRLDELRPVLKGYLSNHGASATWRAALILIYLELGMTAEAAVEFEAISVDAFSRVPHDALWAVSMVYLAEACVHLNAVAQSKTLYEKLLSHSGHNIVTGSVCLGSADRHLGMLAALLKEWDRCERHFTGALALDERCDHPVWLAHSKHQYASALASRNRVNDRDRAADLLKQALSTSERLGLIALKRRCLALRDRLAVHSQAPDSLSPREIKVLRLLAAGTSNNAIASKLFISPHTVANHVRNILAKTNCENRTQAAAYALRHGLAEPK
jgi:DNA-binding CsgD family transcriptional regulator